MRSCKSFQDPKFGDTALAICLEIIGTTYSNLTAVGSAALELLKESQPFGLESRRH